MKIKLCLIMCWQGDVPVSSTEVGTHAIVVELNRTTRQEMVVTVKCVAGNAKEDSDINVKKTITLAPGRKSLMYFLKFS